MALNRCRILKHHEEDPRPRSFGCVRYERGAVLPSPGAGEGFYADANWFLKTRNPKVLRWYTASVQGDAGSAQESFAFIGSGRCRIMRNGLGCVGSDIAYARNKDVLQMDPAMQTAQLAMKDRKGKLHTVSWEAKTGVPWVWDLQEQCATGAAAAVFVVPPSDRGRRDRRQVLHGTGALGRLRRDRAIPVRRGQRLCRGPLS